MSLSVSARPFKVSGFLRASNMYSTYRKVLKKKLMKLKKYIEDSPAFKINVKGGVFNFNFRQ